MSTPQKSPPGNRNSPRSPKSPDNPKGPKSPGNTGNNPSIDQSLSQMSISESTPTASTKRELAKRPSFGKIGTIVDAKVNFYSIDLRKTPPIFDYTVTINTKDRRNEDIKSRARARVMQLLLEKPDFKNAASDYSRRIVSTVQIKAPRGQDFTCTIDYFEPEEKTPRTEDRILRYNVCIQETGQFRMETLVNHLANPNSTLADAERYTSALNIFFSRHYGQNTHMATSARSAKFFNVGPDRTCVDLGFGLNVVLGHFRAVKTTINGLMLNVNTAAAVMFFTGPLNRLIEEMAKAYPHHDLGRKLTILSGELKGLRVTHSFFGYSMRKSVLGIAIQRGQNGVVKDPTAANITFIRDKNPKTKQPENRLISVADHFREMYDKVRSSSATWVVNLGSRDKPNYVPSDLLQVLPGNFYRGLVPHPNQAATMIRQTCRSPGVNKESIQTIGVEQLGMKANNPKGPQARFNIVVSSDMMSIKARILPSPKITFLKPALPDAQKRISGGKWDLRGVKFKTSVKEVQISWFELTAEGHTSAVNIETFKDSIEKGVKNYCSFDTKMVKFDKPFLHVRPASMLTSANMNSVLGFMKSQGIKLVFVILPDKNARAYSIVKMAGDVTKGVHTICTVVKPGGRPGPNKLKPTFLKDSPGEIGNLMLKVNMKLGGVNLAVQPEKGNILHQLLDTRIMFVGADVGHPAPGSMEGAPSIAGVVATTDQDFFRYAGSIKLQNHFDENKKSVEYISGFQKMMVERLELYQKCNTQKLPETIVVYRDGVADNMFTKCVTDEVTQIKQACKEVYGDKEQPKLVFIVAQKRHHTRFYQISSNHRNGFDANGNPNPGFIVDSQICDSRLWDWYLTSHICLQGTSRAAHYTVLHNETAFTVDQLQLLTYHQCWLLGRSTTSISIHPAARHADLLCDRARVYLRSVFVPVVNGPYVWGQHWQGNVSEELKDEMFWI